MVAPRDLTMTFGLSENALVTFARILPATSQSALGLFLVASRSSSFNFDFGPRLISDLSSSVILT